MGDCQTCRVARRNVLSDLGRGFGFRVRLLDFVVRVAHVHLTADLLHGGDGVQRDLLAPGNDLERICVALAGRDEVAQLALEADGRHGVGKLLLDAFAGEDATAARDAYAADLEAAREAATELERVAEE